MEISNEKMIEMYTVMTRIRLFETRVSELFAAGKVPGFVHLYVGEEGVATGVCANLRGSDYITSTHRGHGHLIAKGGDVKLMMAELFGRKTGYCKGKGGSMHIADVGLGILGANGIVGAGPPLATGAALACDYLGKDDVAVCFFRRRRIEPGNDPRGHEPCDMLEAPGRFHQRKQPVRHLLLHRELHVHPQHC